jgi:parvulin-like peptidyl-prolyl isomerase
MILAGLIVGCGPKTGPASDPSTAGGKPTIDAQNTNQPPLQVDDPVIATAGATAVRESELLTPLKEAYGLGMLMYVVQRNLAIDTARDLGLSISESDVADERAWTLRLWFPNADTDDEREKLLDQLLGQPKPRESMMTRTEFHVMMQANAAMRKIAESSFKDAITDEQLKQQFDRQYGASVKARFIMLSNVQEVQGAQRDLAAGKDFAEVAREKSRDPQTRALGGELPPFTSNDVRLPETFRQVAFSLKEGEVSDPIQAGGSWHLIKLEKRIDPKVVKFEDVKESLRESILDQLIVEAFKELRNRFAQQALATLKIEDPVVRREFEKKLAERDQLIRDQDKIKQEMQKQRDTTKPFPATAPAAPQADPPATAPATRNTAPAASAPAGASTTPAPATAPATQP